MKKFSLLLPLLVLTILFSSCSKKKEPTTEEKLIRYWNLSQSFNSPVADTNYFLDLGKENNFLLYMGQDSVVGKWSIDDNMILSLTTPIKNIDVEIDSMTQSINNDGESTIDFFHQNDKISSLKNGELTTKETSLTFAINEISKTKLTLADVNVPEKQFIFSYKPKVLESSFSLYSVGRGLIGLLVLVLIAYLFSTNRKAINWRLVIIGLSVQILLAIGVLYVPFITETFNYIGKGFQWVIQCTDAGINFVFGSFGTGKIEGPLQNFAFKILPTIVFFSALMSMFYYMGILQKIVYVFAWIMKKTMKLSGAESLAAAGNIFLGQTESPLLVKPYLPKMTKSEMMCLMTGGMATIAGGVLASYIGFLGGDDPAEQVLFAKHLLTASIMSAPAAVVAAKILVPETEAINNDMKIPKDKIGTNILEAISNGTTDGLKLAVNVGAMLLVFTALIFMLNELLGIVGDSTGLNEWIAEKTTYSKLSFEFILGYTFSPIAGLMGVDNWNDMKLMGQLLGEKTIVNEFVAYNSLGEMKAAGLFETKKAMIMSTYMLCGFANFASIGIQIGGIGALAPTRKGLLSQLGVKALIGGTLACLFTAVVVGMLM